jgi:hypothetical protein
MLRRIFGPKKEKVKVFGENYLMMSFVICTCQQDIISMIKLGRMRLTGIVACVRQKISAYKVLVGKPGAKRRLGKSRRR